MRINKIKIDSNDHNLSNLVIIVGPNGTGKTTLLQDLYTQSVQFSKFGRTEGLTKKWHQTFFQDDFYTITKQEATNWIKEQSIIFGQKVGEEDQYASPLSRSQAQGFALGENRLNELKELIKNNGDIEAQLESSSPALSTKIKGTYYTYHSVDDRFSIANQPNFQYANRTPASFFYHNKKLLQSVNRYMSSYFGKKLFVKYANSTEYHILIGDESIKGPNVNKYDSAGINKTLAEHEKWARSNNLQDTMSEGHGIRAFIEVITNLADKYQHGVFIDEPELHLYPNLKRRLGGEIADLSKSKQIFIVTHDTDIIDGVINAEIPFDIIRVKSNHELDFIKFNKARISTIRTEKKNPDALKVGFYNCAIFVEGIEDRYVYENAFKAKHLLEDTSYTFVACHGVDRVSTQIRFALEIKLPIAIVVDYDSIYKDGSRPIKDILGALKKFYPDKSTKIEEIIQLVDEVANLTKGVSDRRLGLGGNLSNYDNDTLDKIKSLLDQLKEVYIHMVPIGECKDWVEGSKLSAESVLRKYLARSESKYKPLTDFVKEVASELSGRI
jgi:predicted ATP-dependent endonuclease of OLD family